MKRILSCLLAMLMLVAVLTGCGRPKQTLSGQFNAATCASSNDGTEYSCDGEYLLFNTDGTGTFRFMDSDLSIDWSLKGDALTFTDEDGDTFSGTYDETTGTITGSISGLDYTFELAESSNALNAKEQAAAGDNQADSAGASEEPAEVGAEPAAQPTAVFEPVSGEVDGYPVSILGAEALEDADGEPAIRVYYSFTNTSDDVTCAFWEVDIAAFERGYELDTSYVWSDDDVPEYGNSSKYIYPGVTILCEQIYSCNPEDDVITFSVSDYSGEGISCDFSYSNLPGRPDPIEPTDIEEPVVSMGLDAVGTLNDVYDVALTSYELTESYDGNPAIRIFYEFTNNSDEATSCWWAVNCYTYQDGIELETCSPADSAESDSNFSLDIEPGETISCSEVYELFNTTDMVEATVTCSGDMISGALFLS